MKYLIFCEGRGLQGAMVGAVVECNEWTSRDFGRAQESFVQQFGAEPKHPIDRLAMMLPLWEHYRTSQGVYYHCELAGPDGASFLVIRTPDISRERLEAAVAEIRRESDVVSLNRLTISKMVDFS